MLTLTRAASLLLSAVAFQLSASAAGADIVKTKSGAVEGAAVAGFNVRVFKGIPFAAPPVGDLRWKAPQPAAPWQGVRKATEFGPRCMQAPHLRRHDLPRRARAKTACT